MPWFGLTGQTPQQLETGRPPVRPPARKGFTPFVAPTEPPPGTYDPSIDAQVRATGRGYEDLSADTGIQNSRAQDDFLLQQGELQRQLDRALADAGTARTRGHEDFSTLLSQIGVGRAREGQNYGANVADLQRAYDIRGGQQAEAATAAGVASGGALQQALEKRLANQAHDRAPMDISHQRAGEDFTQQQTQAQTQENRSVADYQQLVGADGKGGRLNEDFQSQLGQLGLGLTRGNEDRANALTRAGRENDQFGLDATAQKWYQSSQAGYDPPQRPVNEHTDPRTGQVFQLVRTSHGLRRLLPTGRLVQRPDYSLRG